MLPWQGMPFSHSPIMAEGLTVVIVVVAGGAATRSCIDAVQAQTSNYLVVLADGTAVDPDGSVLGSAERRSIPFKRKAGVQLASTPHVALIEDTVCLREGWAGELQTALERSGVVGCGGPVILSPHLPPAARALAISDFGRYSDRLPAGPTAALPGCNFAFKRDALLDAASSDGVVDQIIFQRLRASGGELLWVPGMRVDLAHPDLGGSRLSTRFDHGRIYGGLSRGQGVSRRAAAAAKTLFLPLLLTARSLRQASAAERRSFPTLGWLTLQHTAWAAGEFTGAVFGISKEGLDRWH